MRRGEEGQIAGTAPADREGARLDAALLDGALPLGEAVYRALRQALQEGIYRSGDRLREEEIARELGVSRTPVREAFAKLQSRRLTEPAGGKGVVVRTLDTGEVLELYTMREILEGVAARLAAQHASASEIDALTDLTDALEAEHDDAAEMARVNRLFHDGIVRVAHNRYLERALDELQDGIVLLGATTFTVGDRPRTAALEHRAILNAIAARAADEAERLAGAHIRAALRARLKLLYGAGGPR